MGSPAHAGVEEAMLCGFPRRCGDRPAGFMRRAADREIPPHGWAIGHTFEFTFDLPKPANAGGGPATSKKPGEKRYWEGRTSKKAPARPTQPKRRSSYTQADPAQAEEKRLKRVEYERERRQTPERKEYMRIQAVGTSNKRKASGLCKSCQNPAIPGQTRCFSCAEQHRQSRRRSYAERRAADKETRRTGFAQ